MKLTINQNIVTMLRAIQNNPYRFLGVCSNSPAKERIANQRRLKAYLPTGRTVDFPLDLPQLLQPISRTLEDMDKAYNAINLPKDQLRHALFWFINASPIDKMALDYLQKGDTAKAIELFAKKESYSSLINKAVISFVLGSEGEGINCISKVIHTKDFRTQFVENICGTTTITEDDLSTLFIEQLQAEIPASRLLNLFTQFSVSSADSVLLKEKAVGEPIAAINSAIATAKNVPAKDATAQYKAGTKLMNDTKADLASVKSMVGVTDMQYQMVVDNLAKQILQCGINYYNASKDSKRPKNAMPLLKYALTIAISKIVIDRIKTNIANLEEAIKNMPLAEVQEHIEAVICLIDTFNGEKHNGSSNASPNSLLFQAFARDIIWDAKNDISKSHNLLKDSKPHLNAIKNKLGAQNELYIKISTSVVIQALNKIIDAVNSSQKSNDDFYSLSSQKPNLLEIMNVIIKAKDEMTYMSSFDMDNDYRSKQFNRNKIAIDNLFTQLYGILHPTPQRTNSSGSGCMLIIAAVITLSALIACVC